MVLRHPSIRCHPNIVELQGIRWDIATKLNCNYNNAEKTVWPVLVLQKSQFGDLYQFMNLSIGQELDEMPHDSAQSTTSHHPRKKADAVFHHLVTLKIQRSLVDFVDQSLATVDTSVQNKRLLCNFFERCLAHKPQFRELYMLHAVKHMSLHQ
jgi:hypothetical protein